MAYNLQQNVSNLFDGELLSKASGFLGESETAIQRGWSAIVPAVLSAIINKSDTAGGPQEVFGLAAKHHHGGNFTSDKYFAADILEKEHDTIHDLFGNQLNRMASIVSQYSSLKIPSVHILTSIASSAALGSLREYAAVNKWSAQDVALFLDTQKPYVMNAIPAGLDLSPVFGQVVEHHKPTATDHGRGTLATHAHEHDKHPLPVMKTSHWLVPLIVLSLIAIFCLYQWTNAFNHKAEEAASTEKVHDGSKHDEVITDEHLNTSETATGNIDSLGNYIYNTGASTTINLPGGKTITAGAASTEAKLVHFLNDTNASLDSVKGNWFEFTAVTFNKGSAALLPASDAQLQNFVAISKAYPNSKFKIGGYTDNSGDSAVNKRVSGQRANAVRNKLVELDMAASQITGTEGYGPEHPVGDNSTDEGRAMNRRVAVNVKVK